MTKTELIKKVASDTSHTQADVREILNGIQKVVYDTVATEDVKVFDGAVFKTSEIAARTGRNPRTGEPLEIPAGKRVYVKIGRSLKEAVKN